MEGRGSSGPVEGLDVDAVSGWIGGLEVDARLPLRFVRIGNGFSNLTYLVTDAVGQAWVLRRPPLGELLASAHDVRREYGVLAALASTSVPAPRVYGFCDEESVSPVPLVLMEHVDGLVVDSLEVAAGLTSELRHAVGLALPGTLAEIHAVDLEATGLSALSRSSTPYAARQIRRWRGQWEGSRTRERPLVDELADRLWEAMPPQLETSLVHGDFHLLNMIVSPADGGIRAVLDWELCTLGDPLADLGGLLAYWPGPDEEPGTMTHFTTVPGFPSAAEMAAAYAAATGRPLDALGFWHALSTWKVAIITEGILRRARDDARNASAQGVPDAGQVDRLLHRAEAAAVAAGI